MADIIQTPGPVDGRGGGSGAGRAVAVVILIAVVAWLVFGGGLRRTTTYRANVKITPPDQSAPSTQTAPPSQPAPSGGNAGGGSGSAGGSYVPPSRPY